MDNLQDELQRIRALCDAATAGPCKYRSDEFDDWGTVRAADGMPVLSVSMSAREHPDYPHGQDDPGPEIRANGEFYAGARTTVPRLLDAFADMKAQRDGAYHSLYDSETAADWIASKDARILAILRGEQDG